MQSWGPEIRLFRSFNCLELAARKTKIVFSLNNDLSWLSDQKNQLDAIFWIRSSLIRRSQNCLSTNSSNQSSAMRSSWRCSRRLKSRHCRHYDETPYILLCITRTHGLQRLLWLLTTWQKGSKQRRGVITGRKKQEKKPHDLVWNTPSLTEHVRWMSKKQWY